MRALFLILISATAVVVTHGRNLGSEEEDRNVFEWSRNQLERSSFSTEDIDTDEGSYDADDSLETVDDDFYDDLPSSDERSDDSDDSETDADDALDIFGSSDNIEYDRYSVMGCRGGKCTICFRLWKLKGCLVVQLTSRGIKIQFNAFGKSLYSRTVNVHGGGFTVTIKRTKLKKWLRKLLKSDIKIKFSEVNISRKRLCVRVEAKVKYFGRVRWPKRRPRCFTL